MGLEVKLIINQTIKVKCIQYLNTKKNPNYLLTCMRSKLNAVPNGKRFRDENVKGEKRE